MRLFLRLFLLISISGILFMSNAQKSPFYKFKFRTESKDTLYYRLLPPMVRASKAKAPKIRYPLVVFLHGSGERGNDNELQLKNGVSFFADTITRKKFPTYVLVPQCPVDKKWADVDFHAASNKMPADPSSAMDGVIQLINSIIEQNLIDTSRIYVTGISMGGFGTFDLISRYPDIFAAGAPVCGGGYEDLAKDLVQVPLWIFHGGKDDIVNPARSRSMVEAIKKAGGNPKYTEFEDGGHIIWDKVYSDSKFYEWLFAQKRK